MAQHIAGGELPSLQDIYTQQCVRKARKIIRDSCHPSHELFSLLPSGSWYRSIRTRTSRTRDSFFSQTAEFQIANDTHPPTPNTGFHLHTSHSDSDSTALLNHMQLHLLFCTNKLLHWTSQYNANSIHHFKSYLKAIYTAIRLLRIQFTMCILWKCVYCMFCKCVYCVKCVYCCLCILSMIHILLLVLPWHRVLYLRISPSVHLCAWCVTIKEI